MTDKVIKNCYGTDPVAVFILKKNVTVHNHYSARCFQNENPSFGTRQKQFIAFVCIICDCEEHGSEQLRYE